MAGKFYIGEVMEGGADDQDMYSILWLLPFFGRNRAEHNYDTATWKKVKKRNGTYWCNPVHRASLDILVTVTVQSTLSQRSVKAIHECISRWRTALDYEQNMADQATIARRR